LDIKAVPKDTTSAEMGGTEVEIEADLAGKLVGGLTWVWKSKQTTGL
jgi:hypothetical protein